jgi:aminoglycoside phosphotransferase (APT) family kinase protein
VARGSRSTVHAYGHGAVIKVPDPSTPSHWIVCEAEYSEAARTVGAPAPRLLGMEELSGRAASVWERVHGISMWERVIERPDRRAEIGRLLADIQLGLFELMPPVSLPSQRDRMVSKIRRAAAMIEPSLTRALDLLPAHFGEPRLCHGDLHPSNVILARDGPMLVDWFDASRGEAIADIARSLLLLGNGASPPQHLPGADRGTLGDLTDAYVARLREALDLEPQLLARWHAINAVARLAEGMPPAPLMDVWHRFDSGPSTEPAAQAAAS